MWDYSKHMHLALWKINRYFYIYTYISKIAFEGIKYLFSLSPLLPHHSALWTLNMFLSTTTHLGCEATKGL